MTSLPENTGKKLGLVIDLDTCVGCQACATSCKEWNAGGYSAPLSDQDAHGSDPHGTWLNRVHSYEVGAGPESRTVHFPRSCLHCETPACVTVCPTGASYKRASDGIVLVNPDTVWTWNAIGRRTGAAALDNDAPESTRGFLLNHLINELLPEREGGYRFSNSDPITGQAAWYDLRVKITKAAEAEAGETSPRFERLHAPELADAEVPS